MYFFRKLSDYLNNTHSNSRINYEKSDYKKTNDDRFKKVQLKNTDQMNDHSMDNQVFYTKDNPVDVKRYNTFYPYTQADKEEELVKKIKQDQNYKSYSNIAMYRPKQFNDVVKLIDSIKMRVPIIVEFSYLTEHKSQKLFDFLSGAIYALNGNIKRIGESTFLFTPSFIDITENFE